MDTKASSLASEAGLEEGGQPRVEKVWGDAASLEGPVVSPLYARFHIDLASAVAAAVGDEDW